MKYEEWAGKHLDIKSLSFDEANVVCPFHEDHSPSLRFNLKTGLWLCHGCHESGNAQTMALRLNVGGIDDAHTTIDEVESMLADIVDEADSQRESVKVYSESWNKQFQTDRLTIKEFWRNQRGLDKHTIKRFELGYDVKNKAATIPLRDETGQAILGVIRRFTDPKSKWKYLNPKGFKKAESLLFLDQVDGSTVALVEGPIDALKCWSAGVPAVAIYGSSISDFQVSMLRKHGVATVISFFDNDPAGRLATMRADQMLRGIVHFAVEWPYHMKGEDPGGISLIDIVSLYAGAVPFHRWSVFS